MDDVASNTVNTDLKLDLKINNVDWSHRIGKTRVIGRTRKSRPIIVRFYGNMLRSNVFSHKHKILRGKHISVAESLTKKSKWLS